MRFTVIWDESVQDELARIWLQAADQQAVADAADHIDQLLKFSPEGVGQAYDGDRRLIVEPLEVIYSVSMEDCMVRVLHVDLLS
ncbi:MAG: hypothetical protein E6K70_08510 [Planctomycetota bacterium]|nr:MAG: hypothetical protein E6K70_08510 [Planctomycetota bacterium]